MPGMGDFYNKNNKKKSKAEQAKAALKSSGSSWVLPQPQIVEKKKKNNW